MAGHLALAGAGSSGGGGGGGGHNPPASPLFLETFDNAVGFDLTGWTKFPGGSGVINENFVGTVFDGTQSLRIVTVGGATFIQRSVSAIGTIYLFFQFGYVSHTGQKSIIEVNSNTAVMQGKVTLEADGSFKIFAGSSQLGVIALPSASTKYNCWFSYSKDDGLNRKTTFGFSTGTTRPTSGNNYREITGPTVATDVALVSVGVAGSDFGTDVEYIYDYVLADDVQIGDNP